jgi:hypothetical protein
MPAMRTPPERTAGFACVTSFAGFPCAAFFGAAEGFGAATSAAVEKRASPAAAATAAPKPLFTLRAV